MENPGLLNWRRWSSLRKSQVVATGLGLLFTIVMLVLENVQVELPHESQFRNFILGLGMLFAVPPHGVAGALGLENELGRLGWPLLYLVVYSLLSFCPGSLIGFVISPLGRKPRGADKK